MNGDSGKGNRPSVIWLIEANREPPTRLSGYFELHALLCFLLHDGRSFNDSITVEHIAYLKRDEVTGWPLTIEGEIEKREIALTIAYLQSNPDSPYLFRFQRGFLTNELALVPGLSFS